MSEDLSVVLFEPRQAHSVMLSTWEWAKPQLVDQRRLLMSVRRETRSDAQNRLLHSRIADIARQIEWAGATRDLDTWKRLLMAAWLRARGESVEILPALDGHGVDVVFRRTSQLNRAECAEFSEYILAWGDGVCVRWSITSLGREWSNLLEEA